MSNSTSVYRGPDRSRSLVAALPPLLLGLGILLNALIVGAPWYTVPAWRFYLGMALELLAAVVIAAGGAIALWRRLPDWGYTWLGAALMLLAGGIKVLAEERAETGQFLISPAGDIAVMMLVFLAGLAALAAAALRGWAQARHGQHRSVHDPGPFAVRHGNQRALLPLRPGPTGRALGVAHCSAHVPLCLPVRADPPRGHCGHRPFQHRRELGRQPGVDQLAALPWAALPSICPF